MFSNPNRRRPTIRSSACANLVLTPHLGASTAEAQENVGIEVARQLRDFLLDGAVVNAVNMPNIDPKTMEQVGPFLEFAETLGRILSQLAPPSPRCSGSTTPAGWPIWTRH